MLPMENDGVPGRSFFGVIVMTTSLRRLRGVRGSEMTLLCNEALLRMKSRMSPAETTMVIAKGLPVTSRFTVVSVAMKVRRLVIGLSKLFKGVGVIFPLISSRGKPSSPPASADEDEDDALTVFADAPSHGFFSYSVSRVLSSAGFMSLMLAADVRMLCC